MTQLIIAYTDGACKGNGKQGASAGGFGAFITYPNGDVHKIWGGEPDTTNNRMELMAAITALKHTPSHQPLQLWTDSGYVKDGITKWIKGWKSKNWKKSDGKPVLNLELWQELDSLATNRNIDWQWIKGHAGHAGNEMADSLANLGVMEYGEEFIHHTTTPPNFTDDTMSNPSTEQPIDTQTPSTQDITDFVWHTTDQNPDYDGDTSRYNPNFWAILPEPINRNKDERELIMDTETTGFDPLNGDRIIEVGIIEMVGRKFTGQKLHVYINPDRDIPEDSIRVHGIYNEFVADKPKFEQVANKVYEFMVGTTIIAHNARFDMSFLDAEFNRSGLPKISENSNVIDSLAIAKKMFPGQKNSLDALVKRLDVGKKDRTFHGALLDSEILAEVYLAMTGGQTSLDMSVDGDERTESNENTNLTHLSALLVRSVSSIDDDSNWRKNVLK